MDLNTIFFGLMIIGSISIFFFFGKFRASSKQRDRDDRIDWTQSLWKKFKSRNKKH